MIFKETPIPGAFVVELEKRRDFRGFFARAFCTQEFKAHGLEPAIAQVNYSRSDRRGTMRGIHYQVAPAVEHKFIRCIRGALWDVIVDMRPDSPTFRKHFALELSADNQLAIYAPALVAHGALSLTDEAEMFYSSSGVYDGPSERGLRFDDPALGIDWPIPVEIVTDKDRSWPLFSSVS